MPRPLSLALSLALIACGGSTPAAPAGHGRTVEVEVGAHGYTPSEVTATAGEDLHLVFRRTTDEGCGQEVVFPTLDLRRELPLDQPVSVDVTMPASGSLAFTCGMGMYQGAVVVR
jgi:plastocyanin domain-containing protein